MKRIQIPKVKWTRARRGFCYQNAYYFAEANPGWQIAHGIAECQDPKNPGMMGHAWCEFAQELDVMGHKLVQVWCADAFLKKIFMAEVYYAAGLVSYVRRYTLDDARREMHRHKIYGAWDERIKRARHTPEEEE